MHQGRNAVTIAPALLGADAGRLAQAAIAAELGGADVLHVDVMDGRFVPAITFGARLVRDLRPLVKIPIDVHLLVESPEALIDDFARAGADLITVHVEAVKDAARALDAVHAHGCRAGLAICPETPVERLEPFVDALDLAVVMTVVPGTSSFIPRTLETIAWLRARLARTGRDVPIAADGGIGPATVPAVVAAGARWLVAASAVYGASEGVAAGIAALRRAAVVVPEGVVAPQGREGAASWTR